MSGFVPWLVLGAYAVLVLWLAPRRATSSQFFRGRGWTGAAPSLAVLAASATITWVFAKSIANAANLTRALGPLGGLGYATYYASFFVAAAAIYFMRTRGGHGSLASFLSSKYGAAAARIFLLAVAVRLFNEVWSNTKVAALYFGAEGSGAYWAAVAAVTALTLAYSLRGGLRGSLLTDAGQMVLAALLLGLVLVVVLPDVRAGGPVPAPAPPLAGLTFCVLALVQTMSYPFHDPVLTDRGFLTHPRTMVWAFVAAGLAGGAFILLFSTVGLYALQRDLPGPPTVAVPASFGLPMLLAFNGIMLTSAGSTLDSTFASTAKLGALDWRGGAADALALVTGRRLMVALALLGNLPLFAIYLGDKVGPAIIAATTISGTMVMGLAPIVLLGWLRPAGALSFHLAFWPGLALGALRVVEGATGTGIFPAWVPLGTGRFALDLGVNVYGLALCSAGFVAGAAVRAVMRRRDAVLAPGAARS